MCLAIPGELVSRDDAGALPMGNVSFGGITKEICLAYVPEAAIGDYVLVHSGFALSVVDAARARAMLDSLDEAANRAAAR